MLLRNILSLLIRLTICRLAKKIFGTGCAISFVLMFQAAAGIAQTTGWPGVVTVMGKWFGKGKRGLIFGIWNSHTSIGNILGELISSDISPVSKNPWQYNKHFYKVFKREQRKKNMQLF